MMIKKTKNKNGVWVLKFRKHRIKMRKEEVKRNNKRRRRKNNKEVGLGKN